MRTITSSVIREWIVFLMDRNYSPRSVNRKLSTLRSFFRYLYRNGQIESNPVKGIVGVRTGRPLPYFVRDREMNTLLLDLSKGEGFEDERDRTILEVFYSTGIRCSELVGLNDEDIDFESCLIRVTGKGNKQRLIPFSKTLEKCLFVKNKVIFLTKFKQGYCLGSYCNNIWNLLHKDFVKYSFLVMNSFYRRL